MKPAKFVGERIAKARRDAGLTQAELGMKLAEYLKDPAIPQAVSQVENGARLTPKNLFAFAAALLDVPASSFYEATEPVEIELPGENVTIGPSGTPPAADGFDLTEELFRIHRGLRQARQDIEKSEDSLHQLQVVTAGVRLPDVFWLRIGDAEGLARVERPAPAQGAQDEEEENDG